MATAELKKTDAEMIVFTHIPKTAGSSFNERIWGAIPNGHAHIVTDDGGLAERGLSDLYLVGGHIRFPVAWPIIGEATYVAAVRHPLQRILSHFFFAVREGHFPILGGDPQSEFLRFYDAVIRRPGGQNLQCQFFSADGTFDRAASVIERHYTAVWDTERMDDHFATIVALCGLSLANVDATRRAYVAPVAETDGALLTGARPKKYVDFLRSDQVERLLEENAEDAKLHRWVEQSGGLRAAG